VGDANQPTDGDAGVDEEANAPEHTQQYVNEPEQENNDTDDEAPTIHMEIPGVTEENIEIPGVIEGVPEDTP
jgi:HSP20 family molecular chaperone IbpA